MLIYLVRRIAAATLTLLLICLVTFVLMHAVPGDPFEREIVQSGKNGGN